MKVKAIFVSFAKKKKNCIYYKEEDNVYIQVKDEKNNIQLDDVNSIKKEEEWEKCLICFVIN